MYESHKIKNIIDCHKPSTQSIEILKDALCNATLSFNDAKDMYQRVYKEPAPDDISIESFAPTVHEIRSERQRVLGKDILTIGIIADTTHLRHVAEHIANALGDAHYDQNVVDTGREPYDVSRVKTIYNAVDVNSHTDTVADTLLFPFGVANKNITDDIDLWIMVSDGFKTDMCLTVRTKDQVIARFIYDDPDELKHLHFYDDLFDYVEHFVRKQPV